MSAQVAVVGAGLSGLMAAHALREHGVSATLFDKGRRPGGRANTREHGAYRFDHGAQYFTVRDPAIEPLRQAWLEAGVVREWDGRLVRIRAGGFTPAKPEARYVAVPGMVDLAAHLARDLPVHSGVRIGEASRRDGQWRLVDVEKRARGPFEALIVAVPAPQAVPLLAGSPRLEATARAAEMAPCWAGMFVFEQRLSLPFDGAFLADGPLSWIARDSSKPGRPSHESWVVHAGPEWTRAHRDRSPEEVLPLLLAALRSRVGTLPPLAFQRAHRWGYALVRGPSRGVLYDADARLGACGDWCRGGRVEGALLSGLEVGRRVADSLPSARRVIAR